MTQPVIDTLQVSNVLRKTGMEPEQADGIARVLGAELGAHVVVQKDLESGFQGVRSDLGTKVEQVRSGLEAKIQQVDTKVDVLRAELTGRMDGMEGRMNGRMDGLEGRMNGRMDGLERKIEAVNWKVTFMVGGFGLLLAVLTVASGMGLFARTPPSPQSYSVTAPPSPSTAPAAPATATPIADP